MKTLILNRGRHKVFIDDEDYDDVMELPRIKEGTKGHQLNWTVVGTKENYRVRTGPQYGPFLHLHHYIMCPGEGECVIFLSENRLDHRKENLKVVPTWSVRMGKERKHKKSFGSQYRGVQKSGNGWAVTVVRNGKGYYLGFYLDELHAARAYDIKAKELHGEFAVLNNVPEDIIPVKCKRNQLGATSQYIGVYVNKRNGSWNAMIRAEGKRQYLGSYVEEIHAARAYDIAAKKYRGPDEATNNIPESVIPVRGKQHRTKKV